MQTDPPESYEELCRRLELEEWDALRQRLREERRRFLFNGVLYSLLVSVSFLVGCFVGQVTR